MKQKDANFIWSAVPQTSCWYCSQALQNMGRFCNKACAEAFEEDELAAERKLRATQRENATAVAYA